MIKRKIIVIILILTMLLSGFYFYYENKSLQNINIKEKLVIKFYKDDNNYLVDLNKSDWNILNINLNNNLYDWDYIKIHNWNWVIDSNKFIEFLNWDKDFLFFSQDTQNLIANKSFNPKCIDCNYIYIYNIDTHKNKKIKIYDGNKILIIEDILGYISN